MIRAEQISVIKNHKTILSPVDFSADLGAIHFVIGRNGAGKTTLLRSLAGLESLASGAVFLQEKNLATLNMRDRAELLAWAPERCEVPFSYSLRDVLLLGRFVRHRGYPGREDKMICEALLDEFGLSERGDERVQDLSSGELRKVFIARALGQEAKVVLLDEPCSHLDWVGAKEVLAALHKRSRQENLCVVLTCHDLRLVEDFADKVVALADGGCVSPVHLRGETRFVQGIYGA